MHECGLRSPAFDFEWERSEDVAHPNPISVGSDSKTSLRPNSLRWSCGVEDTGSKAKFAPNPRDIDCTCLDYPSSLSFIPNDQDISSTPFIISSSPYINAVPMLLCAVNSRRPMSAFSKGTR